MAPAQTGHQRGPAEHQCPARQLGHRASDDVDAHAKHLLETTALPVKAIAEQVGYEDAAFFGRLFRRKVQLSAPQYPRRFGGLSVRTRPGSRRWRA
ncbi:MAG TPA: helix-turn-helix domain-containing protein [Rubrivivax sp.]|nr:helix-turn-helix domain-containing protein [Rubrivivax sp.]